jgi:hypothetical protein
MSPRPDHRSPVGPVLEVFLALLIAGLTIAAAVMAWGPGMVALGIVAVVIGAIGQTMMTLRRWAAGITLVVIGALAGLLAFLLLLKPETTAPPPAPRSAYLLTGVRVWPGGVVPVCWLNRPERASASADDLRMILAVKAAEETWSSTSKVSFQDVGVCPAEFKGARLLIGRTIGDAEAPALGAGVADQDLPIVVPFVFPSRSGCAAGGRFGGADVCAHGEAVHELGHVLGLPDLHYSKAAPEACKATLRQDHPWLDLPYDPASVMNACNPDHLFGKPSPADIAAIRAIYGG